MTDSSSQAKPLAVRSIFVRPLRSYLELVAEPSANADVRDDLASVYNDIGLALEDWGDASGALDQRKALALREASLPPIPAIRHTGATFPSLI